MAGKTAILTLKILADAKDALKGLNDTADSTNKFQSGVKSAAVPATAALVALGAAGMDAAQAAAEDEAAATQLALALKNSTGASDSAIASTEEWITKTSKAAAVADDELRPALATLARATGDTEESQKALQVALDVSAATGKDVGSVSDALAKAYGGQTTSLKRLVPGLDDAVVASGDMNAIMDELARTTGGAAAAAADTAAGKYESMKIQMGETKETIGSALLPVMSKASDVLGEMATVVQENSTAFLVIAGVIGAFAGALVLANIAIKAYEIATKVVTAATKAWTVVQKLLNLSIWASPITWIVAAIVALIVVIVLIATKTTWFQDIWETVWGAVVSIATAAWSWVQSAASAALDFIVGLWNGLVSDVQAVWNWILAAIQNVLNIIKAVVMAYINIYVAIWNGLVAGVTAVWNWIKGVIDGVLNVIKTLVQNAINAIVRIWEGIKASVGAVFDWLKSKADSVLNGILTPVHAIEDAFQAVVRAIRSVIDWLGNIKMPKVLDDIGSAISNLNPFSASSAGTPTVVPTASAGLTSLRSSSTATGNGGPTIVIQGAIDPVAVARQIRLILRNDERRRSGVVIA